MALKMNPLVSFTAVLAYSFVSCLLSPGESMVLFLLTLVFSRIFGIRILRTLAGMRLMLLTAVLIALSGLLGGKDYYTVMGDVSKFLSLISVSALFVMESDLLAFSSALGGILGRIFGRRGWKASSSVFLALSVFPLVFDTAREMLEARKARGGLFFAHPVKNTVEYTVSLMTLLFEKTVILQDALYSRAYRDDRERTVYPLALRDRAAIMVMAAAASGVLIWKKLI